MKFYAEKAYARGEEVDPADCPRRASNKPCHFQHTVFNLAARSDGRCMDCYWYNDRYSKDCAGLQQSRRFLNGVLVPGQAAPVVPAAVSVVPAVVQAVQPAPPFVPGFQAINAPPQVAQAQVSRTTLIRTP